jgi:hypothetical protein
MGLSLWEVMLTKIMGSSLIELERYTQIKIDGEVE